MNRDKATTGAVFARNNVYGRGVVGRESATVQISAEDLAWASQRPGPSWKEMLKLRSQEVPANTVQPADKNEYTWQDAPKYIKLALLRLINRASQDANPVELGLLSFRLRRLMQRSQATVSQGGMLVSLVALDSSSGTCLIAEFLVRKVSDRHLRLTVFAAELLAAITG